MLSVAICLYLTYSSQLLLPYNSGRYYLQDSQEMKSLQQKKQN